MNTNIKWPFVVRFSYFWVMLVVLFSLPFLFGLLYLPIAIVEQPSEVFSSWEFIPIALGMILFAFNMLLYRVDIYPAYIRKRSLTGVRILQINDIQSVRIIGVKSPNIGTRTGGIAAVIYPQKDKTTWYNRFLLVFLDPSLTSFNLEQSRFILEWLMNKGKVDHPSVNEYADYTNYTKDILESRKDARSMILHWSKLFLIGIIFFILIFILVQIK